MKMSDSLMGLSVKACQTVNLESDSSRKVEFSHLKQLSRTFSNFSKQNSTFIISNDINIPQVRKAGLQIRLEHRQQDADIKTEWEYWGNKDSRGKGNSGVSPGDADG